MRTQCTVIFGSCFNGVLCLFEHVIGSSVSSQETWRAGAFAVLTLSPPSLSPLEKVGCACWYFISKSVTPCGHSALMANAAHLHRLLLNYLKIVLTRWTSR